ncbi:MAG: fosfomycin resistance glutathione transferase [Pseudomonadota bacterium]
MSTIRGLNHLTLAVSDLDRSVAFYRDVLGLSLCKRWPGGAHLEAGEFWLCLSLDPLTRTEPHRDYTHMAFDVGQEDFVGAVDRLKQSGTRSWKENRSEGDSFYFLDPDGHKLELHVGSLRSRLEAMSGGR